MDPLTLSRVLMHYKRKDVQDAIVASAVNKEAVGSFGGKGYARRPDVLMYGNDVLEQVKNGVTSFHVSEELWSNPQRIDVNMKRNEYDALRVGWDLVLDIDCPVWEFAQLVTDLFIRSLREHGISAVTVKFSGNKGFHVGVPFEAFPERFRDAETKDLFPEGPRKIAAYLLDFIGEKYVKVEGEKVSFGDNHTYTIRELEEKTGKGPGELVQRICENCGKKDTAEEGKKILFTCPQCESRVEGDVMDDYRTCAKCGIIMERSVIDVSKKCCASPNIVAMFDPLSIVEVDTVLIAPRHLYRAPYSYHEKSGLVSVPINPDKIFQFEKKMAEPGVLQVGKRGFLVRENVGRGQATKLLVDAMDFVAAKERKIAEVEEFERADRKERNKEFEDVQTAIPEQFFPPCIKLISAGLKDGKKRAVFILRNFLSSVGWEYDDIEDWLHTWNEKNPEPLREQFFVGQIRYAKSQKKRVLPPNCDNSAYYKSFGVCKPDGFCRYIKNPANYAIKRARYAQKDAGKGKKKAGPAKKPAEDVSKGSDPILPADGKTL